MNVLVSRKKVNGSVSAPPSKSYTIRGLMCGAMADGQTRILKPLGSDDTIAASRVLKKIGVGISNKNGVWKVYGGNFFAPAEDLFCRESATTLRFMMALCTVIPGKHRLTAGVSLSKRPVTTLVDGLTQLTVKCSSREGFPPVLIEGGILKGGNVHIRGDISSQYVSALLLVAPLSQNGITVKLTTPLESKPYVLMTLDTMQVFGITVAFTDRLDEFEVLPQKYQPTSYLVEGDWSSASYLLALGALAGEVRVNDLSVETMQGDRKIIDYLGEMGAWIKTSRNTIIVKESKLKAIKADLTDCIDLLPTVAVLAAVCKGSSELVGITRARIKESDRVAAVSEGLNRMGIATIVESNRLIIIGGNPKGAVIDSKNDHRIAMAFGLLGTVVGDTIIQRAECVNKTYPEFWDVLQKLGSKVATYE